MNNSTNALNERAAPSLAFEHFFIAERRHRPLTVNWFRIAAKLIAFALGCLLSLALALHDCPSARSKVHVLHTRTGPIASGQIVLEQDYGSRRGGPCRPDSEDGVKAGHAPRFLVRYCA